MIASRLTSAARLPFLVVSSPGRQRTACCQRCGAEPESGSGKGPGSVEQKEEEVPLWVRREAEEKLQKAGGDGDLPFGVLLLFSCFTAIAAVGSIFEFVNQNAIFGQLGPDNPLYTPILGFFAITGVPMAGWLFFKAVTSANKAAERMDKVDGY